jgi:hypothetical protein
MHAGRKPIMLVLSWHDSYTDYCNKGHVTHVIGIICVTDDKPHLVGRQRGKRTLQNYGNVSLKNLNH